MTTDPGPSPALPEMFHPGLPDNILLGEEERHHDVVHGAVVGAAEALPGEVRLCLLVFSLAGGRYKTPERFDDSIFTSRS